MNFPWDKKPITGNTLEELLTQLKKIADPNCNTCFGRGHVGYKGGKTKDKNNKVTKKPRVYLCCPKCVDNKL